MHLVERALPDYLYERARSLFESRLQKYTEHSGRYGSRISDPEIVEYMQGPLKAIVCEGLGWEPSASKLLLSEVWACEDMPEFEIPYHVDDVYKRISCVLYMGSDFQGTSFLDISRGEITVEPKENLLAQGHRFRASSIFKLKQPQIHYGIQPMYKTNPSYAQLFFDRVPGFVGVTANTFQDSNKDFIPQLSEYVMLSVGSWNHRKRDFFPICKGSFRSMNETLRLERRPYRLRATDRITVFVQNYSPDEYWFGWETDDGIDTWLARERRFLTTLLAHTSKRLYVKFHPKTAPEFTKAYKVEMAKSFSLIYSEGESLEEICDASRCVVVNSGSSAIHACLLGAPLFYIDDALSNIPMWPFGTNDVSKIDHLTPADFPDQEMALDFVASQMFHIADFPSKAYISTLLYNESCY